MTSPIDICNNALAAVGSRSTIASLDEGSNEALQCRLQYESTRDTLLRSAPWGFARRVASGALLKTATGISPWDSSQPPPPWQYQYAYPSDCILFRYLIGQNPNDLGVQMYGAFPVPLNTPAQPARWAKFIDVDGNGIEVQTICTNAPQAIFCYTRRVIDVAQYDSLAQAAFIAALGSQICIALTGNGALAKELAASANNSILSARVADANETTTVIDYVPETLAVRGVSGMTMNSYSAEYGPLFEVK